MSKRMVFPGLFGVAGCAILIALGVWQVQRLTWKEALLAQIDARINAEAVAVPASPDPTDDLYLPVKLSGDFSDEELHVLASVKRRGAGYRIISVMEHGARRIMVDRGFVATERKDDVRSAKSVEIEGNLHWPNEVDSYTPDPDLSKNIWFARDVELMAPALDAEPFLVVARASSPTEPDVPPLPIDSATIPNDHLQYAITWFSLAVLWLGMTAYLLWRIRQRTV